MKIRNIVSSLFIIGVLLIVVFGVGAVFFLLNPRELVFAEARVGRYNDGVKENVSILNKGYTQNWDKIFETTDLRLEYTGINESKDYVLLFTGEKWIEDYILLVDDSFTITIDINTTITGIDLCSYEYNVNSTSLEFFSLTIYPLVWIDLYWSSN